MTRRQRGSRNSRNLHGFAAITDDPPADVAAAGHDRRIINLKPEHVEAWFLPLR
jgi:putative SOS response-associated peptidase YedK